MKKYKVSYESGATGFGWDEEVDTITEVIRLIENIRHDFTAKVTVFDSQFKDFVFYKRSLTHHCETDFIISVYDKDLRTRTRKEL